MYQISAKCEDCDRPYGHEHGFPDLIIPYESWIKISPSGDEPGLLCPSCICQRLHHAGIKCPGAFMSGPIESVSYTMMHTLRRVENIELAIEGRNNHFGVLLRPKRNKLSAYFRTVRAFFPAARSLR